MFESMRKKMNIIRILITDDHPTFRKGLRALIDPIEGLEVIGEASTGEEAIRLAETLAPDLILMDLQMPGESGVEATRKILKSSPHIRILMVTLFDDSQLVFTALRAGARGYILKDSGVEEMARAIQAVGRGEAIFSPAIASKLIDFFNRPHPSIPEEVFPSLTQREREVLGLIAQGRSNPEIASELTLSIKTVHNYVSNIFSKLQVADRAQAIIKARNAGVGKHNLAG